MNISQVSFLPQFGLLRTLMVVHSGIVAAWIVDECITVLQRSDGSYSFKAHGDKMITKKLKAKIIRRIKT